jgi:tetratricopeptide (TPR) repeat protein
MDILIIIGTVIFTIYLIYRLFFIRHEPLVQDLEIKIKSKQIKKNPNNAEYYFQKGFKLLQRGNNYLASNDGEKANECYGNAKDDFEKCIEIDPQMGEAYCYKGLVEWFRNDEVYARFSLLEAEKLGSKKATELINEFGLR